MDLNQRLPVITPLTSFHFVSCASLPSPQAPRGKHCGQPPFGLLSVKYKESLFRFKRRNQKEGHGRWPYPYFWLPLLDLNQRLPVITQLTPLRFVSCASLPSPQAPRDKRCGQPPFGLLSVKYRESLIRFKRRSQKEGHGHWPYPSFWLTTHNLNRIIRFRLFFFLSQSVFRW